MKLSDKTISKILLTVFSGLLCIGIFEFGYYAGRYNQVNQDWKEFSEIVEVMSQHESYLEFVEGEG